VLSSEDKVSGNASPQHSTPGTQHRPPRMLRTDIWLTPFDLGVRQQLDLIIEPGPFAGIYEVRVALKRLSGDDANWHRMNRPFLTELRKQFLQWRTLPPAKMLEYVEQSRRWTEP